MKHILQKGGILLLLASLITGQLLRLPLPGQGGGLLLSDVATVLVLFAAVRKWMIGSRNKNHESRIKNYALFIILYSLFIFVLWSLFTLIIQWSNLGPHNFLIAFLYWLRLSANLLLLPALLSLLRDRGIWTFTQKTLFWTIAVLVIGGLFQRLFFPDLHVSGFDPHEGRLFSSWLDPNLFGGFLVLAIFWLSAQVVGRVTIPLRQGYEGQGRGAAPAEASREGWKPSAGPALAFIVAALLALALTESRSSFLALAGTSLLITPLLILFFHHVSIKIRLGLIISGLVGIVIVALGIGFFLPERLTGLLTVDETAQLRVDSLTSAWQLFIQHPWLGVGAGAYQFAARDEGFIQDFSLHSRAGADNSLLTLAVTTGIPGVILFLLPWAAITSLGVRQALQGSAQALGVVASFLALLLHSQFVNSFLYSHLLITLIIIVALQMTNDKIRMTNE